MTERRYIKVLLPLRLKWEPLYYSDGGSFSVGERLPVPFAGKEYIGVVTCADASGEAAGIDASKIKPVLETGEGLASVSPEEIELWRQVADYYLCTAGEVYKAAYPAGKVEEEKVKIRVEARLQDRLERLEDKISKARKEETRERYIKERDGILEKLGKASRKENIPPEAAGIRLSVAQEKAYSQIKEILAAGKPALLEGVTGSGKTEIYLKLAGEALRGGRNVLFLVPEIALSRQLEERVRKVFPGETLVCHSGETIARRIETATSVRHRPYLVLGTRSSVFLPHRNLGLVIIDEEHDSSYKQDNPSPRYNAREAAIMLGRIFGAGVILGSATPSLESLYNCSVGRFARVALDRRYFNAEDSEVEIIDTIAERKKNGMVGHFSRKLIDRIHSTLAAGGQVAILRERRSWAPLVQCQECGHIPRCVRCNAPLSLHRRPDGSQRLICQYCGKVYEYSGYCSRCEGTLKPLGAGTQRIEEETRELFPEARVARLDSDNTRSKAYETEVIRSFAAGETDILVGTSIVAKGFDFSGLSLVAVLSADSLLSQQDYKADERGMQLLEQFRGRCGRRSEKGLFVIQTAQPDHPVYKRIRGDLSRKDSLERLLGERKIFGYPPYSRVVNIVLKDSNLKRLELMSRELASAIMQGGFQPGKVVGPYSPAVDKVGGEGIRIIRLLLPKDNALKASKRAIALEAEKFGRERKYSGHLALDVDPV